MSTRTKQTIQDCLQNFAANTLKDNSLALFKALGYTSNKQLDLESNTAAGFLDTLNLHGKLDEDRALLAQWQSVDVLFQLTADEIGQSAQINLFTTKQVDNSIIESYLFLAIELQPDHYTRTDLAHITREVNKQFPMPVLILFKHGPNLTFSIINRRLHKRDSSKDVLEKVTLIKDINTAQPHRAHIEILFDLSLEELYRAHNFDSFVALHRAWQTTLDSSELNKRFFKEIANWYFWAVGQVTFPEGAGDDEALRNATSVIRLITRLIFVWFLKEKGLVPDDLFNRRKLADLLTYDDPQSSTYYKAILQNLFFATLNQEMGSKRAFRGTHSSGQDQHYMIHNVYRYERYFTDPQAALALFATIPFLNGGLFECLDKKDPANPKQVLRIDGFSDRADNPLTVPDHLFFTEERDIDLNRIYGTRGKRYKVRGLIEILSSYKFTITENTPIEEEIALDPELLGKVFENLLAAYNPETETTARKQTGSFYTPREIVNYMVDESLIAYLNTNLSGLDTETRLRHLLAYNDERHLFSEAETTHLIAAIDSLKILDPACGSGAFPMGILHKLVFILGKLDPGNARWKERQIDKAAQIPDSTIRERAIADIEEAFERNALDYGRKLYLIENCIYGVDIQPIAVQIAKLRFFISLVVDQRLDEGQPNRGVRPLPNLETKFVAANTLLGIERPPQMTFKDPAIAAKEKELEAVRRRHFSARTPATKEKYRQLDADIRAELGHLLRQSGFRTTTTEKLAAWNPYDQNAHADFFDPEWMFEITDGFDIVIGNPPYVRQEKIKELKPALQENYPDVYEGRADIYVYFFKRSIDILNEGGMLTFIASNKYFKAGYGQKLRQFLGKQNTLRQLIDFGDTPVFTAIAYPSIIILQKQPPRQATLQAMTWKLGPAIADFPRIFAKDSFPMTQSALTTDGWRLEPPTVLNLLNKLRRAGVSLGEYVEDKIFLGLKTGFNKAFIIDRAIRDRLFAEHPSSKEIIKPFLRGRDVKRWNIEFTDQYIIFTKHGIEMDRYPAIEAYLRQFKSQLEKRATSHLHAWYELQQPQMGIYQDFEKSKIVWPDIAKKCEFTLDDSNTYLDMTLFTIPKEDYSLLAILNSSITEWFMKQISSSIQNAFIRFKRIYLSQLPIPDIESATAKVLESLVKQILTAKQSNPAANVSALEAEIDQLVYQLYGLTAEEIAIVEGKERQSLL